MGQVIGAPGFATSGDAYDRFMGRYSGPLSALFADFVGAAPGMTALDVGCGPGALTRELADRLGPEAVAACDPSASFVAACRERNPGVAVVAGAAEELPFPDRQFDLVAAQLVLHFVKDPTLGASEMVRVVRPGGRVAASVWDFSKGMQMLRAFWDAAVGLDPGAPDELRVMRFGRDGEIAQWLTDSGLADVTESTLTVNSSYRDFDELWDGFLVGVGPAGSYAVGLPPPRREELRAALFARLGEPSGAFTLTAVARAGHGTRR